MNEVISLITVIATTMATLISAIALILTILSIIKSTKRFELSTGIWKEILEWFSNVILCLKRLEFQMKDRKINPEDLSLLSGLIEIGRFYYYNQDMKDNYGSHKPYAYRGYRALVLDFLVWFYEICDKHDYSSEYRLKDLEREFVSSVYEDLKPMERHKFIRKFTNIKYGENIKMDEYFVNQKRK